MVGGWIGNPSSSSIAAGCIMCSDHTTKSDLFSGPALPPIRRHIQGAKDDDVAVPPLLGTSLVWGLFMGVSSNLRYQVVFGLERLVDMTIARKVPQVRTYSSSGSEGEDREFQTGWTMLSCVPMCRLCALVLPNSVHCRLTARPARRSVLESALRFLIHAALPHVQVAYGTTVAIRFVNNVIGGEQFVDLARWAGVQ